MMRSMFAGVSGLKTHQTKMDVIGNNIANVNTTGYKSSRATFQEMLTQTLQGATAPTATRGGMNPQQIGLGVSLGSIDVNHTQGNTQSTGYMTDLAIEGDGFFVLGQGNQRSYTRAGAFGLDELGNFGSQVSGLSVMGYAADEKGVIDLNSQIVPMHLDSSVSISPRPTTKVNFAGNLDNRYGGGESVTRSIQLYDSRGREQTVNIGLSKDEGANTWTWDAEWVLESNTFASQGTLFEPNQTYVVYNDKLHRGDISGDVVAERTGPEDVVWTLYDEDGNANGRTIEFDIALNDGDSVSSSDNAGEMTLTYKSTLDESGTIEFYEDGQFSNAEDTTINLELELANDLSFELDFSGFTHFADELTGKFMSQDGYANGALEGYYIDQSGRIVGSFSNGLTRNLGQVAIARFSNPAGLERSGSTTFVESPNSGEAQLGAAGMPGYGTIAPSSLEMSNVDLSEEFTEMIITQRGFQANSRIITSSDEMLQELVNLKR